MAEYRQLAHQYQAIHPFKSLILQLHPSDIIHRVLFFAFLATIVVIGCYHFSRNLPIVNRLLFDSPLDPLEIARNRSIFFIQTLENNCSFESSSLVRHSMPADRNNTTNTLESKSNSFQSTKSMSSLSQPIQVGTKSQAHEFRSGVDQHLNSSSISPHRPRGSRTEHDGTAEIMRKAEHPPLVHNMMDAELFWWASTLSKSFNETRKRVPKVAFLFLTRGPLHLTPVWERFFNGHEGKYSIYVHAHPSYRGKVSRKSVFYGRRIPSKRANWGSLSVVAAEHRLLASALLDLSNQRFVLLSESCIPLFPFNTIYGYLMNSTESFVEVFDDPEPHARGRYNWGMWPVIEINQWRKGSQWVEVDRRVAAAVVSDINYTVVFVKHYVHCPDEHYLPTFMNIKFGPWCANRSLTYVDWSEGGYHPKSFHSEDITWDLLWKMRNAYRCKYNGHKTSLCKLFARKMLPDTLHKLLKLAHEALGF